MKFERLLPVLALAACSFTGDGCKFTGAGSIRRVMLAANCPQAGLGLMYDTDSTGQVVYVAGRWQDSRGNWWWSNKDIPDYRGR